MGRVKLKDLLCFFIYFFMIPIALIRKLLIRNVWLIGERGNDAQDNGYWLYKYICENKPNQKVYYIITKDSKDYEKVSKLGNVIIHKSLKHWLYYMSCSKFMSAHKGDAKPNACVFYVMEVMFKIKFCKTIMLRHGIVISNIDFLYKKQTNVNLFLSGIRSEYNYVKEVYGYKEKELGCVGFCRYDNLLNKQVDEKQILIMPTWRSWLGILSNKEEKKLQNTDTFIQSEYYLKWTSFLENEKLHSILIENDLTLKFYLHPILQKYTKYFNSKCENIKIVSSESHNIQELLIESSLLITDYSSVFFDFGYMLKPVLFYQFDYEKFRSNHYKEGWFDYANNPIGKQYMHEIDLVEAIDNSVQNKLKLNSNSVSEITQYFEYIDTNNCERNYNRIKEI